jgi:hypothetical protein
MAEIGENRTLAPPSNRHPSESWDLPFLVLDRSDTRLVLWEFMKAWQ